jgi:hypothetical protein
VQHYQRGFEKEAEVDFSEASNQKEKKAPTGGQP